MSKPLVDLQVYEPQKPRQQRVLDKVNVHPSLFAPILPNGPYLPPQYNPFWPHLYNPIQHYPLINAYNINVNAPDGDHTKISAIYEDILPNKQFVNTMNTLGERINIYNFVRSVFIKQHDGEDINLDGKGNNGLLSYLKFLDLNPYNTNQHTNNPYKGLPTDMLIYRSCYPIRYDEKTGSVQCARNSIGMNIRIYKLTFAEYNVKKLEKDNYYDFNIWREIIYYEYIRENILKPKHSPNFVLFYAYYISENPNIDFDKIAQIMGKARQSLPALNTNGSKGRMSARDFHLLGQYKQQLQNIDQKLYSGRALIGLTEAPMYNIYGWSSMSYQIHGGVRKMVNNGYHKSEIWMSILFQLISALYLLQIHKIAFTNFTVEDNVYIKDLTLHENITTYWKYRVDGLEYYIPNYGYLVLVDSNFKDINSSGFSVNKGVGKLNYKIYGDIFGEPSKSQQDLDILRKNGFVNFKIAFNSNSFAKVFNNFGGAKLPEDVLDFIKKVNAEAETNIEIDIGYYISKYMRRFLNNRIGTYLTEGEIRGIRKDDSKGFYKGQIVVHEVQNDTYKFVSFLSQKNAVTKILTKEDGQTDIIEKDDVNIGSLFSFSKNETIVQHFKAGESNLNEENLLETYVIDKI